MSAEKPIGKSGDPTAAPAGSSPFAIKTQRVVPPPPETVKSTPDRVLPASAFASASNEQTIPPTWTAGATPRRMVPPPDAQGRPRVLTPAPVLLPAAPAAGPVASPAATGVPESVPARKSGMNAGLIGGLIVGGLALAAGGGYFFMRGPASTVEKAAATPSPAATVVAAAPVVAVTVPDAGDELGAAVAARNEAEALIALARTGGLPGQVDEGLAVAFAGASGAQRRFDAGELRAARELWVAAGRAAGAVAVKAARLRYEARFAEAPAKMLSDYAPVEAARLIEQVKAAEQLAVRDPKAACEAYAEVESSVKPVRAAAARQLAALAEKAVAAKDTGMALYFYDQELRLTPDSVVAQAYVFRHKFKPGQRLTTPAGLTLAYVPPGTFKRGTPPGEAGRDSDEGQHSVTLTRGFYIGTTEITQAAWDRIMGTNQAAARITAARLKPEFVGADKPMILVTWADAQEFCRRLGERERARYRLPTEAEWEYACRAGVASAFHAGPGLSLREANIDDGSSRAIGAPVAVGTAGPANAWGLSDLHGNVWEWCGDWSAPYPASGVTDPSGPADEQMGRPDLAMKVVRGGSWNDGPTEARAGNRWEYSPVVVTSYIGFRVIREIDFSSQP